MTKWQNDIIKFNTNELKSLDKDDTKGLWREVNKLIHKGHQGVNTYNGLTAIQLNDHYADISTDRNYVEPREKLTCNSPFSDSLMNIQFSRCLKVWRQRLVDQIHFRVGFWG